MIWRPTPSRRQRGIATLVASACCLFAATVATPSEAFQQRLAVAGHCDAYITGVYMHDSNLDSIGPWWWSSWGDGFGGGGNPPAGQIVAPPWQDQVTIWCGVPDDSDHPKWNIAGWNVQGYNSGAYADFAEACVKFWNGTGWSCTSQIPLPLGNYAYNIMADPNYTGNPVWSLSANQNNFAFLYLLIGSNSQYYGDYYWGT